MGAFPTGAIGETHFDNPLRNPGSSRADLLLAVQRLNDILDSFADALGICDLDASGFVPASRLDNALKVANNLSEVTAATARTNLGFSATGSSVVTAATAAAALAVLAGVPLAGGTITGAILYAADPTVDNALARKKYVDDSLSSKIKTAVISEEYAAGTNGLAVTIGSWVKRVLNVDNDPNGIVGLSSGVFELAAGTYLLHGYGVAAGCEDHRVRIYNTSDSTVTALGCNVSTSANADEAYGASIAYGFTTITANKFFELQHRCETTNLDTAVFGKATNWTLNEVFASVSITKIA